MRPCVVDIDIAEDCEPYTPAHSVFGIYVDKQRPLQPRLNGLCKLNAACICGLHPRPPFNVNEYGTTESVPERP